MKKYLVRLFIVGMGLCFMTSLAWTVEFVPPKQRLLLNKNQPWPKNHFLVLGYHDVEDEAGDERYLSVKTSALNEQIAWLYDNGYQAVSVQQILDANQGKKPLPNKAVLLTFDDGYRSFYTRVYPLLKAYNWPALWAPVGAWLDAPADQPIDFGGLLTERRRFADWEVVRALKDSPLVEIGAHTWDSHYGIQANPQGSRLPAVANRLYDAKSGQYESDADFKRRIEADIKKITEKITEVTGKPPIAWVWPYGAANGTSLAIAQQYGYQMAFILQTGLANVQQLNSIPRLLLSGNPSIETFARQVTQFEDPGVTRVMHVDLDYVYDTNPRQQRKNIDALIQRVHDMKISHVFLQAYADPKGDGTVQSLYFPNRWLPMRADLFNFVSWQLQTRADIKVYAWMPVLAFDLAADIPRVQRWSKQGISVDAQQYQRLSPWNARARQQITDIYQDLARHTAFHGILFHDDALLSDFEDASMDAIAAYQSAGFGQSIARIRQNPELLQAWSRYKSRHLIQFTQQLTEAVRDIRGPQVETARNIYAMPILEPESELWFAQNLDDFIAAYDWTAVMAMPLMEGVSLRQSNLWLQRLVTQALAAKGSHEKVLFELQTLDWRKKEQQQAIPTSQIVDWMVQLQTSGARHFGYYPDDFLNNHPALTTLRPVFSSHWYPSYD